MALKSPIDSQIIWKSFHGRLTAGEQQQLQAWLDDDVSHREYFRKAGEFYCGQAKFPDPHAGLDRAWQSFVARERFSTQKKRYARLAVVASLVVLLGVGASVAYRSLQPKPESATPSTYSLMEPGTGKATLFFDDGRSFDLKNTGSTAVAIGEAKIRNTANGLDYTAMNRAAGELRYNIVRVPRAGGYVITLADGTRVWMNAESSLRFPVSFGKGERKVELQGQAYFEVAHDAGRPFLVWSGNQEIRVLGTQFDLKAYQTDATMTTTLIRGSVLISLRNNPGQQQTLSPSEQCTFDKVQNSLTKRSIETTPFVSWRAGKLIFENEELGEIMKTLSRWYAVDVVFASENARHIRFTGTLMRDDDIRKLVNKIAKTNEIKIDVNENRIRIE